ncbi:MAG: tRNA 2-thiocytidine(32) synthetase TtcA [Proteobacteria bacterium]|nr:MAG: tRNA 2-thiocytidine(32) synthetase TtcA [Pseudomonadota bacterium]
MDVQLQTKSILDRLRKQTTEAIADFAMIKPGDKVMVCVSGGKDSAVMLVLLEQIRRRAPFPFTLHPVLLDQKQPGFSSEKFETWVKKQGHELTVLEEDTYSIVLDKTETGKSYCGLCSRLRRGILYNHASKMGYQKIALGHHRDDLNTTLLMNLFFNGRIASMPPKLKSDDGRNIVIRPMAYLDEDEVRQASDELEVPIIPCNLCGSNGNMQRGKVKKLLKAMEGEYAHVGASVLNAQKNIRASQLLDKKLWAFEKLEELSGEGRGEDSFVMP